MLFSKRKNAAVSQGTQGQYVKRESPPAVPSLTANAAVAKTRRSPVAASSLMQTSPSLPPSTLSLYRNQTTSAMADSPPAYDFLNNPVTDIREEITDEGDPNDNDPTEEMERRESKSTNSDSNSAMNASPSTSFAFRNTDVLSSRSFNRGGNRHIPRKFLTTSHSIGNVEQELGDLSVCDNDMSAPPQARFQSLQTLPRENVISIQQFRSSFDLDTDELPLPPNWEIEYTNENQKYYVDHHNRRTHWVHPLVHESLKPGWKKVFEQDKGVFYLNENLQQTQFEHPGIGNPIFRTESVNVASRSNMELSAADLHIIEEKELPPWLLMYAQEDSSLDHLLEWNLFDNKSLIEYDNLILKLFKQQVMDIVKKYERIRNVLNKEIHRRDSSRPPPRRL